LSPDEARLDPEIVAFDPPARHEPGDEAERREHADERHVIDGAGDTATREHRRDEEDPNPDRRASRADDRRQRVEPMPGGRLGTVVAHRPAA